MDREEWRAGAPPGACRQTNGVVSLARNVVSRSVLALGRGECGGKKKFAWCMDDVWDAGEDDVGGRWTRENGQTRQEFGEMSKVELRRN